MSFQALVYVLLVACFFGPVLAMLWHKYRVAKAEVKRLKERQATDNRKRKLEDSRENIGGRIYNKLLPAARENPTGRIQVSKWEKNAHLGFTVVVRDHLPNVAIHLCPVFQVYVILEDRGICVLNSAYGPTTEHLADDKSVAELIEKLQQKTREFGVKGQYDIVV